MTIFGENIISLVSLIFSGTAAFAVALAALTHSIISMRKSRYVETEQHVMLSAMREAYDRKMSQLALELTATPERWKEINHLLISAQGNLQEQFDNSVANSKFLKSFGLGGTDLIVDRKLVFVLTSFSEEERETFTAIKEVCETAGFVCKRGDEERIEGEILQHIVKLIAQSNIVIANIGSRNPNVFYELGIAHALSKTTVLLSKSIGDAPFDVQGRRILVYKDRHDLKAQLAYALVRLAHSRSDSNFMQN